MLGGIEKVKLAGLVLDHLLLWGDLRSGGRVFSMSGVGIPDNMEPVSALCRLSLQSQITEFWADIRAVQENSMGHGRVNRIYALSSDPKLRKFKNLSGGSVRILGVRPLSSDSAILKLEVH